eukprot:CAMPEP_0178391210 /NCGR_PEP_ID=MMETSP0689_2-20121128/11048_1 /TAXON_ID=160604 /ORGANISM="Amphidinium massartii, Strain CS-259" /LENGTH=507 /DNA_ID=CAMNT_0020011751 /DNA_START=41 /DNA_END=1560 /DNA_ORIENTATION=-
MADRVEEQMQEMVPALDDLRRKRIFSEDEIRQIVKRRRNFEYLLQRPMSGPEDYLKCVRYEVALECLRKRKSDSLRWRRKTVSDFAGIDRIHNIFKRACLRFQGDKKLWYQRIDFCLRSGTLKGLPKILAKAVKIHPKEAGFWLLAADRELKFGHIQAARTLLLRALRCAPESSKLWLEFLRLEVQVARRMEGRRLRKAEIQVEEGGGQEAEAAEPIQDAWGPVKVLFRRALKQLGDNRLACDTFLRQAIPIIKDVGKRPKTDHFLAWVKEVDAALESHRPTSRIKLPTHCFSDEPLDDMEELGTSVLDPEQVTQALQLSPEGSAPAGSAEASACDRSTDGEVEGSFSEEWLTSLLKTLTPGMSPRPLFDLLLADALAHGPRLPEACDMLLKVASKRWDVPGVTVQALLAVLQVELLAYTPGASSSVPAWAVGCERVCKHFEDLLVALPKEDPQQVEWWARFYEFAQKLSLHPSWAIAPPRATDVHWRAMRAVPDQAAFLHRVRELA